MLTTPTIYRLAEYKKSTLMCPEIKIHFEIFDELVFVEAWIEYESEESSLCFHGEELQVLELKIDNKILEPKQYSYQNHHLIITHAPLKGTFYQKIVLRPSQNMTLQGLFKSGPMFATQCEAEGFRRMMFSVDRPDVLSRFKVTLTADKGSYPVLLSNGELQEHIDLPFGRHKTVWYDPFPKPTYLFALVAGKLALTERSFITQEGRSVALKLYCDEGYQEETSVALDALEKAMVWDENVYKLHYDLNVFHIVASFHFNMGAMENKSLNIFNAKYVLGS
jgi:aminopeptidase N